MKLHEIKKLDVDVQAFVLASIEAAMDRSSRVLNFDVDSEEVYFSVRYDFPEHRNGVVQKVRAVAKAAGNLNAQKGGDRSMSGIDFQFIPTTPLTDTQVNELEIALRAKYPDTI